MRGVRSAVFALALCASAAQATDWPNGAKVAVVLTYDDALDSQLDHAVPVLEEAGLKASFFLSNIQRGQIPRWRKAAQDGHELANHSMFHACAAALFPADPRYTSEAYTPASIVREIEQQDVLLTAIDGKAEHGYGVPCSTSLAGGVDYMPALKAANIVFYARTRGATAVDLRADASAIDPFDIPARDFPEATTGAGLIAYARQVRPGGMAVYVFHGVGGDHLRVSEAAHRELVTWLAQHRKDIWVAPLGEVIAWAKTHPGR